MKRITNYFFNLVFSPPVKTSNSKPEKAKDPYNPYASISIWQQFGWLWPRYWRKTAVLGIVVLGLTSISITIYLSGQPVSARAYSVVMLPKEASPFMQNQNLANDRLSASSFLPAAKEWDNISVLHEPTIAPKPLIIENDNVKPNAAKTNKPAINTVISKNFKPKQAAINNMVAATTPAVPLSSSEKIITLVIDDMGESLNNSAAALALPEAQISYSFLPYGRATKKLAAQALESGKDILLHMPMQPEGKENPGNGAFHANMKPQEIQNLLIDQIKLVPGVKGASNHMGSLFLGQETLMKPIMQVLKSQGMYFFDSVTKANTKGYATAKQMQVPYALRDVFLDHENSQAGIMRQLQTIEKILEKNNHVLVIAHPRNLSIKILNWWIPRIKQRGIKFVSLSKVIEMGLGKRKEDQLNNLIPTNS